MSGTVIVKYKHHVIRNHVSIRNMKSTLTKHMYSHRRTFLYFILMSLGAR